MKLFGLALLAVACSAGSPPKGPQLAPISLFMQQHQPVSAEVLTALQEEVASILAPGGYRFEWHDLTAAGSIGTAVELAVVTFHGTCQVPILMAKGSLQPLPLGFTNVTDGEILPFATVDCDRTRSFLANALAHLPQADRAPALGRALGRILAHELFHIFAKTQRHGRGGVAKEAYTVADLMSEDFELGDSEFEILRASPSYNALTAPSTAH